MGEPVEEGGVRARVDVAVEDAVVRELDPARVCRDQLRSPEGRLLHPRAGDRVRRRRVGADDQNHVGALDVVEGARAAGAPERLAERVRGGGVADTRAVVDVVRADGRAEDALHRVAVLVRRTRRREPGDRVRPVLGLDAEKLRGDAVERLLPGSDPERPALADERRRQAVARARELVREAALEAGVASVRRSVAGTDRDDASAARVRLEPAADAAVAAGRRDRRVKAGVSHSSPLSGRTLVGQTDEQALRDRVGGTGISAGPT